MKISRAAMSIAILLVVSLAPAPTEAITGDPTVEDFDFNHTYVGQLWGCRTGSSPPCSAPCSVTLIAPRVAVTTARCGVAMAGFVVPDPEDPGGDMPEGLWVSFGVDLSTANYEVLRSKVTAVHVHPAFNSPGGPDSGNVAVLELATIPRAHDGTLLPIAPVALPPVGILDSLATSISEETLTAVGFGPRYFAFGFGRPIPAGGGTRRAGISGFLALGPGSLTLSIRQRAGFNGACREDEGGPALLSVAGTDRAGAIFVDGDETCAAVSTYYRLDTASAHSFLGQFLTLP